MLLGLFSRKTKAKRERQAGATLCQVALTVVDGAEQPPEWIELVPAGAKVEAVDGRVFSNAHPEQVIAAFRDYKLPLPIDFEHATETLAPKGHPAPAAGWIVDLTVRDGAIFARVEWTPRGRDALATREYRFISPAFFVDAETREVVELTSAGLTNRPALTQLPAVARRQEEDTVNREDLIKALGLAADASDEQIAAAVAAGVKAVADAKQAQTELATARAELARGPGLDKFTPRADYEAVLARAVAAEKLVADTKAAAHKAKVDAAIEAASKAGKITPATVEYHRMQCSTEDGLKRFEDYVTVAPVVGSGGVDETQNPAGDSSKLTDEERRVAVACGLSEADYLKGKEAVRAQAQAN